MTFNKKRIDEMTNKLFFYGFAISILGLTACTTAAPEAEEMPAAATPDTEISAPDTAAPELTEGISLSEDGSVIVMEEFSSLEAYCMDGSGKLAISYMGEAGGDDQLVSCGTTFEDFDTDRETSFADVNIVEPTIADSALQLQDGEYTRVKCLSNQTSLEQAVSEPSDGHMVLTCL